MIIPNIKEEIKNNKKVKFLHYKEHELWYETESGFKFPVPIEGLGSATLLNEDKAILFMGFIRKQINFLKGLEVKIKESKDLSDE